MRCATADEFRGTVAAHGAPRAVAVPPRAGEVDVLSRDAVALGARAGEEARLGAAAADMDARAEEASGGGWGLWLAASGTFYVREANATTTTTATGGPLASFSSSPGATAVATTAASGGARVRRRLVVNASAASALPPRALAAAGWVPAPTLLLDASDEASGARFDVCDDVLRRTRDDLSRRGERFDV